MKNEYVEKMAKVLCFYSLKIKKNEIVKIEGKYNALPLIIAFYEEVLKLGAFPYVNIIIEDIREIFYKQAKKEQLKFIFPFEWVELKKINSWLTIWTDYNKKYLTNVPSERIALFRKARKNLYSQLLNKIAKKEIKWCGTAFPDIANAMDAEMSLREYEDFIFRACFLDKKDPIKEWKKLSKWQERLVKFLEKKEKIKVKGEDVDLELKVKNRKWINCDGKENFPDGEVFTSPIEDSVNGFIRFSFPCVYGGKEVDGVELYFKKGIVVKAKAEKNEDYLLALLNTDEGAKRVGEFSFGTNYHIQRFMKNTLFDEKIGGTIHLALGCSLFETGGKNKSSIHWDMVCDLRRSGEIYADNEIIFKDGKFLID
uniref:Aminopeptidase n=1 Tax=candidate division WOR-3 bacterium TaxID=2052148 RepID=A0A7V3ZVU5_UNCW3